MIFRGLADSILILHFCFVLFVIFGGLLVLRNRLFLRLHLPALAWGILVELFQLPCPLTWLEKSLRQLGGEKAYAGGFVEHYVSAILYPAMSAPIQIFLGVGLIVFNTFIYVLVLRQMRRINSSQT